MNIPLDRLYHYIENIAQEINCDTVIIYRFYPHGSKNIEDLNNLTDYTGQNEWLIRTTSPSVWCNDQEPLDFDLYNKKSARSTENAFVQLIRDTGLTALSTNLNYRRLSIFKKNILLHSEQRSQNIKKYQMQNQLIPVYYWSHAVIARDWFRYAEHEQFDKQPRRTFLIYNRAWSNTREYRLKFTDLLIDNGLLEHCQTTCNTVDPELLVHYCDHQYKNPIWKPQNQLDQYVEPTRATAASSADFDTGDYAQTEIEVVLETLFDDDRLHLTEKSLRPIACGQPFILAGTHGSLEYLRSYGFETFDQVWNESYNQIADPQDRLTQIVSLMREIANWSPTVKQEKMSLARQIAQRNRDRFFSPDFFTQVITELKTNLATAFDQVHDVSNLNVDYWQRFTSLPEMIEFATNNQNLNWPTKTDLDAITDLLASKTQ